MCGKLLLMWWIRAYYLKALDKALNYKQPGRTTQRISGYKDNGFESN